MPIGGDLRERLRFERRTIGADDGYGNVSQTWALLYGPVAARIEPQAGSEEVLSERPTGIQPVAITIRWSPAAARLEPQDRAVDQRSGRTFNVIAVANEDQRRGYLNIVASAGAADG
jgi:head-tail adaptor